MSFKYINPGYACMYEYLNTSGVGTLQNYTFNPSHGVACYGKLPIWFLADNLSNLYIRFDFFFNSSDGALTIHNYSGIGQILFIGQRNGSIVAEVNYNAPSKVYDEDTNLNLDALNTIYLSISFGASATVTVNINGTNIIEDEEIQYSYRKPASEYSVVFDADYSSPISNIIISDEEINPKETIVRVGGAVVDTDMSSGDGVFSSTVVGSYVLQTLDTTGLYGTFGSDCSVLALAAVAAPAYLTDDDSDIALLQCRVDNNTATTDYDILTSALDDESDPVELEIFSEDDIDDVLPSVGIQLPVSSATSLANLNGLKIGFVTGEF